MISENYLMKLVKKYAKSPAGKAAIKKHTGLIYEDSNPSAKLMSYGEKMKFILYKHVNTLIKSITLDDIVIQKPYMDNDGLWRLQVSFREGSLHRDSLDENDYPNGLNNIVLLFAKGYHSRNYVYGLWNTTGNRASHWIYWKDIRSRKDRDGSDFLIQAVNEFNNTAGKDIARAELLGDYNNCSKINKEEVTRVTRVF